MKCRRLTCVLVFILAGLSTTAIYANDKEQEGVNVKVIEEVIEATSDKKMDQEVETYLTSEDGYIKIARNNASLKVENATFGGQQLLVGEAAKYTKVTIEIFPKNKDGYSTEAVSTYTINLESASIFEQLIELPEGDNKIKVTYANWEDKISDFMIFYMRRESDENKQAIKEFVVKAKL